MNTFFFTFCSWSRHVWRIIRKGLHLQASQPNAWAEAVINKQSSRGVKRKSINNNIKYIYSCSFIHVLISNHLVL